MNETNSEQSASKGAKREEGRPAATGRTPSDAAVELLKPLGLGGLFIVMLGVAVWGMYHFQQQALERERTASDSLQTTYTNIAPMTEKMIASVRSMLELHDEVRESIEEQRTLAEQSKDASEKAIADRDNALAQRDEALQRRDAVEKEIQDAERQLAEAKQQEARIREELGSDVRVVGADLERLLEIVSANLERLPEDVREDVAKIAGRRLDPLDSLRNFASVPDQRTFASVRQAIIGIDRGQLVEMIKSDTGFDLWQETQTEGTWLYLGTVEQSEDMIKTALSVQFFTTNLPLIGAVFANSVVSAPSLDNWSEREFFDVFQRANGETIVNVLDSPIGETWTSAQTYGQPNPFTILAGQERPMKVRRLEDLLPTGVRFQNVGGFSAERLSFAEKMVGKALDFDGAKLVGVVNADSSRDPPEALASMLNAAVGRDTATQRSLSYVTLAPAAWGLLGAAALQENFQITSIALGQPVDVAQEQTTGPEGAVIDIKVTRWDGETQRGVCKLRKCGGTWELAEFVLNRFPPPRGMGGVG